MDAIAALTTRVSHGKLTEPGPSTEQMEILYRAASRAADHGNLKPWRFLQVEGDARNRLGELFLKASMNQDASLNEAQQKKLLNMPLRAPVVLVAIAKLVDHPKVPEIEQVVACGAAVQNMINAAFALDVGAYWRTGALAYCPEVLAGLGIGADERLVGYVYLGAPCGRDKPVPEREFSEFVQTW